MTIAGQATGFVTWRDMRTSKPQLIAQALAYVAFAAGIGYLSASPTYRHADPAQAVISVVISHPTQRIGECRKMTQEELAEVALNMRRPEECPRARHKLYLELLLDDELLFSGAAEPSGLWNDGPASIYGKFPAEAGAGRLVARLRDSGRDSGFDYERGAQIELRPRQNFVVDFTTLNGFVFDGDRADR
ncbi:MAG: hypothetical protein ACE5G3_06000 [Gammaproteobacteria bacterium]